MLSKIKPYGFTLFAKRYGEKPFWIVSNTMKKPVSYIIVKGSPAVMMISMMLKRSSNLSKQELDNFQFI